MEKFFHHLIKSFVKTGNLALEACSNCNSWALCSGWFTWTGLRLWSYLGKTSHTKFQTIVPLFLLHRPPDNNMDPLVALDESLQKLSVYSNGSPNLLIAGDFNLPDIDWAQGSLKSSCVYTTTVSYKMLDIARDNYISQVNLHPTREKNILDLIFVTSPDLATNICTSPGMSYHDIVLADINIKIKINKKQPRLVNLYNKAWWPALKADLYSYQQKFLNSNPQERSVEENWKSLRDAISQATLDHITQKKINWWWNLPYLTNESLNVKLERSTVDIRREKVFWESWRLEKFQRPAQVY